MTGKSKSCRVPVSQFNRAGARRDAGQQDVLCRISKQVGHLGHQDTCGLVTAGPRSDRACWEGFYAAQS
jgi:hypothetical protein